MKDPRTTTAHQTERAAYMFFWDFNIVLAFFKKIFFLFHLDCTVSSL